jgi:hypothetical protein
MANKSDIKAKIVIDLNKLVVARDEAGQFSINGDGEDLLIRLRKARDEVDQLYKDGLNKVYDQAREYDPNARAIDGKKVRVNFSPAGAKYVIKDFAKVETKYIKVTPSVNTDEVDEYYEHHLELPAGVIPNPERNISAKLSIKDDK